MLRRTLLAALLAFSSLMVMGEAAVACPPGTVTSQSGGICIRVHDPGSPGGPNGTTPASNDTGNASTACHTADGDVIPCVTVYGVWWASRQCYAHQIDLPRERPEWQGHKAGSLWACPPFHVGTVNVPNMVIFWVPPGGKTPPVKVPDPAELAKSALERLPLASADLHTAPASSLQDFVHLETWLWVPQSQWTTLTKSVTAGGTTVAVTARPTKVVWDLGEGSTVCRDAGRPWLRGMSGDARTSCGYTYETTSVGQPGGKYPVRATIVYQVDWVCTGVCLRDDGSLGEVSAVSGRSALKVGERQSVVVER